MAECFITAEQMSRALHAFESGRYERDGNVELLRLFQVSEERSATPTLTPQWKSREDCHAFCSTADYQFLHSIAQL